MALPWLKSSVVPQYNLNKIQTLCQPVRPVMIQLLPSACSLLPATLAVIFFLPLSCTKLFFIPGPSHVVSPLPETLFQIFAFSVQISAWERFSVNVPATWRDSFYPLGTLSHLPVLFFLSIVAVTFWIFIVYLFTYQLFISLHYSVQGHRPFPFCSLLNSRC